MVDVYVSAAVDVPVNVSINPEIPVHVTVIGGGTAIAGAAGVSGEIQFNQDGNFSASNLFTYSITDEAVKIGPSVVLADNPLAISKNVDSFLQVNVKNIMTGSSASGDYVVTADNGDDESNYIDMGINSSIYNDPEFSATGPGAGYVLAESDNLVIGTIRAGSHVHILTDGSTSDNIIASFSSTGVDFKAGSVISIGGTPIGTDVDLTNIQYLGMNTSPAEITYAEGQLIWNPIDKTLDIQNGDGTTTQVAQETHIVCYNNTGATIPNGSVVYISGAVPPRPTIALARADTYLTSDATIGLATIDIPNNSEGKVTFHGIVRGIDTSVFSQGQELYLSATTAGGYTTTQPLAPNYVVHVGHVINVSATEGTIFVDPVVITQTADSVHIDSGTGVTEMNNLRSP